MKRTDQSRNPTPSFDFAKLRARWAAQAASVDALSARLLAEVTDKAAPVLRRFGAERALLFGSIIEGRAGPRSDIDLLVLGTDPVAYWDLRRELEAVLRRSLDLFTEADDPVLVARIQARGQTIYERTP